MARAGDRLRRLSLVDDLMAEKVLIVVERIPPGSVASYGDIGGIVGIGPRFVGNVLATYGSGVPWWRVVNAQGDPGGGLIGRAVEHWAGEGIEVKPNRKGCRIATYRADLVALASAYDEGLIQLREKAEQPSDDEW